MRFMVEIREFEAGDDTVEPSIRGRIEAAVQHLLDQTTSDGVVVVTEADDG